MSIESEVVGQVLKLIVQNQTAQVIAAGRDNGFGSVSVDLIYGLPFQSVKTFNQTLELVDQLRTHVAEDAPTELGDLAGDVQVGRDDDLGARW